jgi:hypothetical protein
MNFWARRPPLWLAAATVAAAWVAAYGLVSWAVVTVQHPIHKDFRIFYVAAEAGLRYGWPSAYDVPTLRALSSSFPAGETIIDSARTYANPPLLAWLITPLTLLPLPIAYVVWSAISLACLIWSWRITAPDAGFAKAALLLGGLAMWPVIDALYYAQPSLLIIALVAAAWWLSARDRSVAAGVALALATALKPQVVLLVPFALLAAGRMRVFISWGATSALLGILFAIALGPGGVIKWWHVLAYVQSDPGHYYFTMAYVLGSGPLVYVTQGLLAVLALLIARLRRNQLEMVFAAGLVGSLASSFHLHESDYAQLVLVAWLVLRTSPSRWHKGWLVASIAGMQAITLARPLPQLLLDATWLVAVAVSSFAGSGGSILATRREAESDVHAGT